MGYVLQAVMNDLKGAGIPFEFGEKSFSEIDFFQVLIVDKSDMNRVDELLAKYN